MPWRRFGRLAGLGAILLILLGGTAGAGEPGPPSPQEAAVRAMEESIERQRSSVERQMSSARVQAAAAVAVADRPGAPDGTAVFFTVPWSQPAALAAVEAVEMVVAAEASCPPLSRGEIDTLVADASEREGLTPELLRAVIGKESSFRPCAVSPKGAMGLMQLMPATARDLGVADPFSPRENVDAGSRLLRRLLERYGNDLGAALGAYNAGPAAVDRHKGIPGYPETMNYVSDIFERLRMMTQ